MAESQTESGEPEIAVAVVDRSWLTGVALGMLIDAADGFRLVGAFRDADELLRSSMRREVALVVANLDHVDGLCAEAIVRLRRRSTIRIALIVPALDPRTVRFAIEERLEALLAKDERPSRIFAAFREVVGGHTVLPRGWQDALAADRSAGEALDRLSGRQREILELLVEGRPNHDIAGRLSISVNTVKFHVRCIYEQLGIRSRLEAARLLAA